ncbi:MAG: hypothetical protein ACRDD7_11480 [Peptostreptococcaceae bacterium]
MSRSVVDIENLVDVLTDFLHNNILLGALTDKNIDYEVCFDCDLWNNGFECQCDPNDPNSISLIIPPVSTTFISILNEIGKFLHKQINNFNFNDFGYKSQIDRILSMIHDLKNKITAINCINICQDNSNIVEHLLYTLVQTILFLITILETINSLLAYIDICGCTNKQFSLFMGSLINNITTFQGLMQDWYSIVMTFLHYSSIATKSYVASYAPKHPIAPPPPNVNLSHVCVPNPQPSRQINQCNPYSNPVNYPY